jgi:acyl-homoserine-lactone acylase
MLIKTTQMKKTFFFLIALLLLISVSCKTQEQQESQIVWDTWGVPHIYANNIEDLFYQQGWAQMHNHANLILQLYGASRGRAAEYWGPSKLQNDILIHTLGFDSLAEEWGANQKPEAKAMINAFANGLNAYAEAHPDAIDEANKVILPISSKDVLMHGMFVIFTRFVGGNDLGLVQRWPALGSNTYAVGPSRSASGNAMLVQNPHLPWWNEFLFWESHLNLNGKDMYGANLVGLPGIAIGFNENLGWSHTNNTIDNTDTYELELKDNGYVLDGEVQQFEASQKTIKIKQDDGSFKDHTFPIMKTAHGPVVNKTDGKVLALRIAGLDGSDMFLQWWKMINSETFDEFETALKMMQIPFFNVMYADREGNIFYMFNGQVPVRTQNAWSYWDRIIPGGKSEDIWTQTHSYDDLPKVKNPENGWMQNANDPPWTNTIPVVFNRKDYPGYMAPVSMSFRPQRSARMLKEDESVTFDELINYKLSTRIELADRLLDDLFAAVDASNSEKAKEAKKVLEAWDREADGDSRGMLLFKNWSRKFNLWNQSNYTTQWSEDHPDTTPDGIADPDRAVRLLEQAAQEIETMTGSLDTAWGDYYRINYAGKDLPGNGDDGSMGIFRVAWSGGQDDKHAYIGGGDSWVGVIEFDGEVKAKVLLSYGNATQKDSPHYGDQLELFSKKELRDAWFYKEAIDENTKRIEKLVDIKNN